MANKKISQLDSVVTLAGNEYIPVVQGGITKNATPFNLGMLPTTGTITTTWNFTNAYRELTSNVDLVFNMPTGIRQAVLTVKQDATGGRTLAIGGESVAINTAANSYTVIVAFYNSVISGWIYTVDTSAFVVEGAVGDTTPPAIVSATVAGVNNNRILVVFDEDLDQTSQPLTSQFSTTIDAVARAVDGIIWEGTDGFYLNLDGTDEVLEGQEVLLTYTKNGVTTQQIKDLSGNEMASFSNYAVTNNVSGGGAGDISSNANTFYLANFNGANGTTYPSYTPEVGTATLSLGYFTLNGAGEAVTDPSNFSRLTIDNFTASYRCTTRCKLNLTNNALVGVTMRLDGGDYAQTQVIYKTATGLGLEIEQNGSTVISQAVGAYSGEEFTFESWIIGNTLYCRVNGGTTLSGPTTIDTSANNVCLFNTSNGGGIVNDIHCENIP